MHWWASSYIEAGDYWVLYLFAMWVILSICLHELAHGWAAIQQGDSTPRDLGRMTFNPMVHMGGMALLAFVLMGITWGSMPVSPSRFRWGRWGEVWVAAAGPLMNLLLAVVLFTALAIVCARSGVAPADVMDGDLKLHQALFVGAFLNASLLGFNLLPVPPLDGGTIVAGLTRFTYRLYHSDFMRSYGIFGFILILATGIGRLAQFVAVAGGLIYCTLLYRLLGGAA